MWLSISKSESVTGMNILLILLVGSFTQACRGILESFPFFSPVRHEHRERNLFLKNIGKAHRRIKPFLYLTIRLSIKQHDAKSCSYPLPGFLLGSLPVYIRLALPIHLGSELAIRTASYSPLSDAIDTLMARFTRSGLQRPVKSASTNTKTPDDSQAGLEEEAGACRAK
ncbi:hypothetical protein BDZ89DRAFT_337479 [Hymenopellis radicata]|nr:hypothetical protein BDZ89DRAFT_337479 [Hymenopellis radicata]